MTKRNLAEEWKLEETGNERDEWKLEPAEQNAASQWQLRGDEQMATDWQPIDYQRERSRGGGNWVLPSLVGVALVAVVAYAAWIGLNRMGLLGDTALPSIEPTEAAPAVDVSVEATPTSAAPTNTPPPPSPTPEPPPTSAPLPSPTPLPMLSLQSAVVNAIGGVNARREPNTTAEIIRVLPQGESFLVVEDRTDWVQVAIGGGELAWVAGEFVDRNSADVTYEEANQRRAQAGLPALVPPAAPEETTPLTGAVPLTGSVPITGATPITAVDAPPVAVTSTISVTVNITVGLNAREEPNTTSTIVQLLASGSTYNAIARSADNQWVQLVLPDGRTAWAVVEFLTVNGDVAALPVGPLAAPLAPATSAPLTETTSVTTSPAITGVVQAVSGVTASITSLSGANARSAPDIAQESLQVVPFDAVLPVIGRSADSQWIQVALEEGRVAWVLANTVTVSVDVATLPVVNP